MKITSGFISLILKLVGGILLISALINYIFLLISPQWQDPNWQINVTNSAIDQGITPLVAIAFLLVAWWIGDNNNSEKPNKPVRMIVFIIASILGLVYLLLVPLHFGNINRVSSDLFVQIDQRIAQQEAQIQGFVSELEAISKNPEQLKQEIEQRNQIIQAGGKLGGQQLNPQQLQSITTQRDQLQQILNLSDKPEELKAKFQEVRNQLESELQKAVDQEKRKAQGLALQQSLKTSISSLMLAIAFIAIGWLGLQKMLKG